MKMVGVTVADIIRRTRVAVTSLTTPASCTSRWDDGIIHGRGVSWIRTATWYVTCLREAQRLSVGRPVWFHKDG